MLGLWLGEQGRDAEAIEAFQGALALAPGRTRSVQLLEIAREDLRSRQEFDTEGTEQP
jgi:cytochrome c-type biogenesis protein CcmH/NrfG